MISAEDATTCVVGILSAFLVSRCQRGRECRICFRVSLFLFRWTFVRVALVGWFAFVFVCVLETIIWCKTYALKLILLSLMLISSL